MSLRANLALCVLGALLAHPPAARAATGDCDDDGSVTIDELVRCVAIALGERPLAECAPADADGDGTVAIADLVAAVRNALDGVTPASPSASSTATPTRTATASLTATPSVTVTPSMTTSATPTASATRTATPSLTATHSATATPVATTTASPDGPTTTPSEAPTQLSTSTATATATHSASATATSTTSATPTHSATPSSSATRTGTATPTPTGAPTRTSTPSPTRTSSATPPPTRSATRSATATATRTGTATAAATATATPLFVVIDIGQVAGGQPCTETSVPFEIPEQSTRTVESVAIDLCVDGTRFDVFGIICESPNDDLSDLTIFPDCRLDEPIDPRGQVHFVVDAASPGGLTPGTEFARCSVPVLAETLSGSYPVRFRAVATSEGVTVVNDGQDQIQVFATDLGEGTCCGVDQQCGSGFCRAGLPELNSVCCESDCAGGICNDPELPGLCQQ